MDVTSSLLSRSRKRLCRKRAFPYQVTVFDILPVFLLFLAGCADALSTTAMGRSQPPIAPEQPILAPYQPHRTIDVWLDDTGSYPRGYFTQAKSAIAATIDQAVQVNSGGMVVFINIITSNSWKPENTLLTIIVPAIGPDPLVPVLQAKPTPTGDPYSDAQAAKKVDEENAQALGHYQQTLRLHHALLTHIRAQVHRLTNVLRVLNPAIDNQGADIWGVFGRASQRLNTGKDMRLLIIVSSLENSTWDQFTPYKTIWGVHVRVLWHYCLSAPECTQNDAFWRGAFLHAGAAHDIHFDDPAQSAALEANLLV